MKLFTSILIICSIIILCACTKKYFGMEGDAYMAIEVYGKNLARKSNMEFLLVGDSTNGRDVVYCLSFRRFPKENLNEARILGTNLVEEFWEMLQKSQEVKDYIKEAQKLSPKYPNEVPLETVGYRIDYWDEDINRPLPPYIAEIMFESGTFYYYKADPETQKLRLIYKESYEDAIQYRNSIQNKHIAKY